jgi:predicted nucleotidyltransferase
VRINAKDVVAGFPILKIRDLLKNETINSNVVKWVLKIDEPEASHVITVLKELGYITRGEMENHDTYEVTLDGSSLALAKAVSPLKRAKADELFSEFMERVQEVNKNCYYLYKVKKVLLFGSYLTNADTVNDIDLAIELRSIEQDTKARREMENTRIHEAIRKGTRFNNYVERLYFPQRQVFLFLKSKSKYLSIHGIDDEILTQTAIKQVYPVINE